MGKILDIAGEQVIRIAAHRRKKLNAVLKIVERGFNGTGKYLLVKRDDIECGQQHADGVVSPGLAALLAQNVSSEKFK